MDPKFCIGKVDNSFHLKKVTLTIPKFKGRWRLQDCHGVIFVFFFKMQKGC